MPALIPASAFRNAVKSARSIMPLPAAKKKEDGTPPPNATLEVSLALYDPVLDRDTGRFYVDVEIDQNMTYEPWVRLGLVRYQEHSLRGLECSLPISSMVRIPADRQLEVEVTEAGRVSLRYSGVGYHGTYIPKALRRAHDGMPLETSTLDITVMHSLDEDRSGAPLLLEGDNAGSEPDGSPHIKVLKPRVTDGITEWVVGRFADGSASRDPQLRELVLPRGWDPARISILVTEYEHLAADDPRRAFGASRSADGFEEPLSWYDSMPVESDVETVVTSRLVSTVRVRLKDP